MELNKIKEHIVEVVSNIDPFEMPKEMDTFDITSIISRMENQRHITVTDKLWNVLRCNLPLCGFINCFNKFLYQFAAPTRTY